MLLVTGAAAAPATHRERAQQAETLGEMSRAAAEYEAAWGEERAPELLYRLGIARRRLREYAKAKEAFRGYLRAAPDGPLQGEVERQLVQLNVLIEAEPPAPVPKRPRPRPPAAAEAPRPPPVQESAPAAQAPVRERAALPQLVVVRADLSIKEGLAQPAPRTAAAPLAAMAASPPAPGSSRAVPWLLAGAALAGAGGAALWWDGARVSRELDSKFVAGELAAADGGRYSRARGESIAGRALAGAAVLLAGAAVIAW